MITAVKEGSVLCQWSMHYKANREKTSLCLLTEDQINNRKHSQELQGDFMPPKLFFSVTLVYTNHLGS